MTFDLSSALPDVPNGQDSAQLPGQPIPRGTDGNLFTGECYRMPGPSCADCDQRARHLVWRHIGMGPAETSRVWQQQLIDYGNAFRDFWRRLAYWIMILDRAMHPPSFFKDFALLINLRPVVNVYRFKLVSAGGASITLQNGSLGDDARHITWQTAIVDPEDPEGEIPSQYGGALPMNGVLTLSSNSQLAYHGGWIAKRVAVPPISDTGNFTLTLKTAMSTVALDLLPGEVGDVYINYYVFAANPESWNLGRDAFPVWVAPKRVSALGGWSWQVNNPEQIEYELEASTLVRVQEGAQWITAEAYIGGAWVDATSLTTRVKVEHSGASSFRSVFDLTTANLAGVSAIRLSYYVQSSSDTAICGGQDLCAYSRQDHTGSWGTPDAQGRYFYCGARTALKALGETGEAFLASYRPHCYQTTCPMWMQDKASNPLDQTMAREIIRGVPWKKEQLAVGIDQWAISRMSHASLASLAGQRLDLPGGYHTLVDYGTQVGGYGQVKTYTQDGDTYSHNVAGLEWLLANASNTAMSLDDPASWPELGPGGGNYTKTNDAGDAADDANDPHKMCRCSITSGGSDIGPYDWDIYGGEGRGKMFVDTDLFFPRIQLGTALQEFDDGWFQRGSWDADFRVVPYAQRVYYAKLILKDSARWDRIDESSESTWDHPAIGAVIGQAVYANSRLEVSLVNTTTSASRLASGGGADDNTQWRQGGLYVYPPEWWRVWNYLSSQTIMGSGRSGVYPGLRVKFTDSAFASMGIHNRSFRIEFAKAHGATDTDPYDPDGTDPDYYGSHMNGWSVLPADHEAIAKRRDLLRVIDEGGVIQRVTDAFGPGSLAGKEITIVDGGAGKPGTAHLYETGPTLDADSEWSADDYTPLLANNEVWLKNDATLGCLRLRAKIATNRPQSAEFGSLRRTAERITAGG